MKTNRGSHGRSIVDERGACKAYVKLVGVQALGSSIRDVGGNNLELGVNIRARARAERYSANIVEILNRNTSDLERSEFGRIAI